MLRRAPRRVRPELARRFLAARMALAREGPEALEQTAGLASEALAQGDSVLAAACAGTVVLVEHLQATLYRHAPRMLEVLATTGPDSASEGADGLLAWSGAAVAHDYGVLPSWPPPDTARLTERAKEAPTDVALGLGCALVEMHERNGQDAGFAALQALMAAFDVQADASPFWRGYWAIGCGWYLFSSGKLDEALQRLETAQALAASHGLQGLGATAALQRARLIEWRRNPAKALDLTEKAVAHGDPARTPLWWADQADVRCRIAMDGSDFHAAVGHARRAVGYAQAAAAWPGYQAAYRVNEAYALLGAGAFDEALVCFDAINETPLPPYQAARLRCVADLARLSAAEQRGQWEATQQAGLARAMRRLRELEWPGVLPLLPEHVGRLFARALDSAVEPTWVRAAIQTRDLSAPKGAPEAWPWRVRVRTLGPFQVVTHAGPLRQASPDPRKASSKPLELLRFLAANGCDAVPVDVVAETLWPATRRVATSHSRSPSPVCDGCLGPTSQ